MTNIKASTKCAVMCAGFALGFALLPNPERAALLGAGAVAFALLFVFCVLGGQ